jgi:hypothetical protein
MPVAEDVKTVTENTTTTHLEPPDFDALLKEAAEEFAKKHRPKYTMPQVLNEYRAVDGKPGLYLRPMCLEVEMRALEAYNIYSDGTAVGLARIAMSIAAGVLYRLVLPNDNEEARAKILAYARGDVAEEELFQPVTEREVGRMFRDSDELSRLVMDPLDMTIGGTKKTEEGTDPNA